MQRQVRRSASVVEKLRVHPLVETVTRNTYIVNGGWAKGFIFVPDVERNECVIIDPGTSRKLEDRYKAAYARAVRGVAERDSVDLAKVLQSKTDRMTILRKMRTEISHTADNDGVCDLFLERSSVLARLVDECGLKVMAVLATHHHIDHLGTGYDLATKLGVRCYLPNPCIFETDKLRDLYPAEQRPDMYMMLDAGSGPYDIKVWNFNGHTEMVGFMLPDGNLVVGDLVGTKGMWSCSVLYMENIQGHLASLRTVGALRYERMLLGHGTKYVLTRSEALELIRVNNTCVEEAIDAARKNIDNIAAAEAYLKPNGDIRIEYIGRVLVTAEHIGAYR